MICFKEKVFEYVVCNNSETSSFIQASNVIEELFNVNLDKRIIDVDGSG